MLNFTLNWTDNFNLTSAWIEVNRSGTLALYTATNQTAGRTSASTLWNLTLTDFPAGTHYWRSNATDSQGNVNTTGWYAFTIATTAPTINLTLNGSFANITVGENSSFTINGTQLIGDSGTILSLHINGSATHFNNGTGSLQNSTSFADRGLFNVTLRYPATQNYTAENLTLWITVEDQSVPVISGASASVTGKTTATVSWTTDDSANSSVTVGSSSFTSTTLTTSHSVAITGLSAGTTYTATIRSCNADNYCGSSSTSFTTTAAASGGSAVKKEPEPPSSTTFFSDIEAGKRGVMTVKDKDISVTKIEVEVRSDVSNVEVKVTELADKPTSISESASDHVYHYVDVTAKGLESEDLKNVKVDFKVEKSWLEQQGISAGDVTLLRYADGGWHELSTQTAGSDATYVYFVAESSGFNVFAIGTKVAAAGALEPSVEPEEEPIVAPPAEPEAESPLELGMEPVTKGLFSSLLFIIIVAILLATTGLGYIYRNRLAIGAKIGLLLGKLKRSREDRLKR